jgi:hypothetical protein
MAGYPAKPDICHNPTLYLDKVTEWPPQAGSSGRRIILSSGEQEPRAGTFLRPFLLARVINIQPVLIQLPNRFWKPYWKSFYY